MKSQLLSGSFLILFPGLLFSQMNLSTPSTALAGASQPTQQIVSIMGNVTSEEGSAPPGRAAVILQCGNEERGRTDADRTGAFTLTLAVIGNDPGSRLEQQPGGSVSLQSLNDCELYGDVPGYTSQPLRMFGVHGIGVIKAGTIILHPMNKQSENFSVSVTSLRAPDNARKNFEKGQEQVKKKKWAAACDYFKKAVQAYPRYALAWLELGRTQLKQNDFSGAQQSFHQATEQDPRLIDAYVQITELAVQKHEWKELADATDQIVRLSPDSNAAYWFLNSAANFNLGNVAQAESSATHGLRLDSNHRVPQLEYLYGTILASRGNVDSAISHIQAYLRLAPAAADASSAQKKLEELQKLGSSPKVASR